VKLRTRIIWISCITVFVASLISEFGIWVYTGKNLKEEALLKGYQECYSVTDNIKQALENQNISYDDSTYLNYLFKSYNDDYNICYILTNKQNIKNTNDNTYEVFNNTVFSYNELSNLSYSQYDDISEYAYDNVSDSYDRINFAYLNYEGRTYIVFRRLMGKQLCFYRLYDFTYVQENMIKLAVVMVVITLVVMLVSILILSLILKKEFKPLSKLNDKANSIAEGFYDERIEINKKDEIGQLGENFNKMAEAVELRTKSMEESEQRKTIFMGNLTHELKTPMTAISGYAQTLLSAKISEDDQREALNYIYQECGRLERLSKKMMNLLELDHNSELELKDTPVKMLFETTAKSCEVVLKNKGVSLETVENGEHFIVDSDLMTDVLINLVDNAVKASDTGSKVILRAYESRIEVQDFGKGIPKEEQEKILEPFYMIDKSRSRKNGGAGLGLAITVVIIKKHNIKMSIESELGKGTRFILEF
jgi:signal transduction histidine kinase